MASLFQVRDSASDRLQTRSRWQRTLEARLSGPIFGLLRTGITPRRLAWSLALGVAIGINPVLGSTTFVCLGLAFLFRLNLVASQISNHLVFPAQLALAFPFLRAGELLFRTGPLPIEREHFLHAVMHHTWATTRLLWMWEWHALVVWVMLAVLGVPMLALGLTPVLERVLHRLHREPVEMV